MRSRLLSSIGAVLAAGILVVASRAGAQGARDPVLAETLFNGAQACLNDGDWTCACNKFRASMELDPAVSTQLNIAKCLDHEGKLTLAWSEVQEALKLNGTKAYADENRRQKLQEYGQKMLADIERRVPKIRIVIVEQPKGLEVRKDGKL